MTQVDEPEADLVAIELALGLLDPDAAAAADERARTDPAFATDVRRWRERLAAWLASGEQAPPAATWPRIAAAIAANDDAPAANRARFWRPAALAAAAAALVLGIVDLRRPAFIPPHPPVPARSPAAAAGALAALLGSPQKTRAAMTVTLSSARDRVLTIPAAVSVGAGSAELWVIPAGGAPVALGLVAADAPGTIRLSPDRARLLVPGASIAVSREPAGGSRTGQPTGPVILAGPLVAV